MLCDVFVCCTVKQTSLAGSKDPICKDPICKDPICKVEISSGKKCNAKKLKNALQTFPTF